MNLRKRDCGMHIRIEPFHDDQKIIWYIGEECYTFYATSIMGGRQFSQLVTAVYSLYAEEDDSHSNFTDQIYLFCMRREQNEVLAHCRWDEEGGYANIELLRHSSGAPAAEDPITVKLACRTGSGQYTVEGRDLCYAVAKACTAVLKKFGFRGYQNSSGNYGGRGDSIDLNQLLYIKAYALNALQVRTLAPVADAPMAEASCFAQEMELLLFDM